MVKNSGGSLDEPPARQPRKPVEWTSVGPAAVLVAPFSLAAGALLIGFSSGLSVEMAFGGF